MIDDYTNEDSEGILEDDDVSGEDADAVFIRRFAAALKQRLDNVSGAATSAYNFQQVAQTLGEITQDEALVATLNAERRRRLDLADKRRTAARAEFRTTLGDLGSHLETVGQGVRFAIHEAVNEHAKASVKQQDAQETRDKAEAELRKAKADVDRWGKELDAARNIHGKQPGATTADYNDVDERRAANALVHYKEAQAQYRSEVAGAQWDYADRLKALRGGQSKRLGDAITALSADPIKALPDGKGEERGTKIALRAVR